MKLSTLWPEQVGLERRRRSTDWCRCTISPRADARLNSFRFYDRLWIHVAFCASYGWKAIVGTNLS